jgi:hypothetical protein
MWEFLGRRRSVFKLGVRLWTLLGLMGILLWNMSPSQAGQVLNDALVTRPFHHHVWQDVLTRNVDSAGEVDFARLRAYPKRLNEYLDQLASISPESDPTAFPTQEDKAAYWVNAHNAIALRIILDHYPITSLNQIPNFDQNSRYTLGGKLYTLTQIQAKVANYRKDPHVLFALTDYTLSAPPILPHAYEGRDLKALTQQAWKATVSNSQLVSVQHANRSCVHIQLSPYFQKYQTALFSAPAHIQEDRDMIAGREKGFHPVAYRPNSWPQVLKPYVSPAMHLDLDKPCSQKVFFKPIDKTLRQVRLLRSRACGAGMLLL